MSKKKCEAGAFLRKRSVFSEKAHSHTVQEKQQPKWASIAKPSYIAGFVTTALLISQLAVLATKPTPGYNYCPSKPYPISNGFSRGIQSIFGMNFAVKEIAEGQIKKQLLTTASGDFNVKIEPYSAGDLMAGKLKNAKVAAKNFSTQDINISSLEAESLCDFISIDYNKVPMVLRAPAYASIKGTITEDDLNKTVNSDTYKDKLTKVNLFNTDISIFDFKNTRIKIADGKIHILADAHILGFPGNMDIPVELVSGLKVSNNKIKLLNPKVSSNTGFGMNLSLLVKAFELVNPVLFDVNSAAKPGQKITLKDVNITDNKINVSGTIWMPIGELK